ncbi:MAG: PD40 domain-containing protein [Gemmatimonadota bacterium]|nr:MAG: PD40 domain-containing protein [Gemmatimonadota bacterium]
MRTRSILAMLFICASALNVSPVAAQQPSRPQQAASGRANADTIVIEAREGTKLGLDLSPDGETIVIDLLGQLWLLPAWGGEARPITDAVRDTAEDLDPNFSPDGKSIVFRSDRPGGQGVWLLSLEEGTIRKLVDIEPIGFNPGFHPPHPAPSPDGQHVAYTARHTIWIVGIEDGGTRHLAIEGLPQPLVRDPTWSPDGSRIAFANAAWYMPMGGRIWEVDAGGGTAEPVTSEGVTGLNPSYAPDGKRIAFFAPDSASRRQLWVVELETGDTQRLTSHDDLAAVTGRPRWTPAGDAIVYSADGKLWRTPVAGGTAVEIPFEATLQFEQQRPALPEVEFPSASEELPARGHMGLALSPDGSRIAMMALGKLWIVPIGGTPQAVTALPSFHEGLTWSPDGTEVAWSAGPTGAEDIFATDVETGRTRCLTSLPGREERPSWSPDGARIAFFHWEKPALETPPWDRSDIATHLHVVSIGSEPLQAVDSATHLGNTLNWPNSLYDHGEELPQWSPTGNALLSFWTPTTVVPGTGAAPWMIALDGESEPVEGFPKDAAFVNWIADSSVIYVEDDLLWRGRIKDGRFEGTEQLGDDPALYPTVAQDGSVLYVSGDGLRIRRPDGRVETLGWPLTYRTPDAPQPVLIHNVRVIDGLGTEPRGPSDILVRDGRIVEIGRAGEITAGSDVHVVDAAGRTLLPGLIDLHVHAWDDAMLPGSLYFGITTVRDMGSQLGRMAALRDAVAAGAFPGPRVILAGHRYIPGSIDRRTGEPWHLLADEGSSLRALALAQTYGVETVKVYRPVTVPAGARLVREAHARGMRITSHCAHALPLVAAGIDSKEHVGYQCDERDAGLFYEDMLRLFERASIEVIPTVETRRGFYFPEMVEDPEIAPLLSPAMRWLAQLLPPQTAARFPGMGSTFRSAAERLHAAGVTLGAGSDVDVPGSLHWELEGLVLVGLSPLEAIAAATGAAARIIGAEASIGTIEEGKLADLVVLDADPLEDISNTRKIWKVFVGGHEVDRSALLEIISFRLN